MGVFSLGNIDTTVYTGSRAEGLVSTGGNSSAGTVMSTYNTQRVTQNFAATHSSDIRNVEKYLETGKIPEAMQIYQELLNEAQEQFGAYSYSEDGLSYDSIVDDAIAMKSQSGLRFSDMMTENKHSSVVTGLLQGIPVVGLMFDSFSNAEALAKTTGIKVRATDQLLELFGGVASGAATGAAAGAFGLFGIGLIPGAIAGGIWGGLQVIGKAILNDNL